MSKEQRMVSAPPYIGLEPLVGRYYPAKCRRCGWVGSSEELTEDDAQCTREVGDRLCLGDCDELDSHDLLGIIQAMARPQGEPAAWLAQAIGKDGEVYRNTARPTEITLRDVGFAWGQGVIDRFTIVIKPLYAEQPAPAACTHNYHLGECTKCRAISAAE
ncbi:hypothetical protein [Pseudomonas gingeri]